MNEQRVTPRHPPLKEWLHSSLAKTTLIKMTARIAVIIAIAAVISYFHIFSILNEQVDDSLQQYIVERGKKESAIFLNAEGNHETFKQTFLEVWPSRELINDEARFNALFEQPEDGTWRLNSAAYEGIARADGTYSRYITGYVGSSVPHSLRFHNKLLLTYDLIDRYADAWAKDYANLYVSMPENVNLIYWPEVPWGMQAGSELDITTEEWVVVGDPAHNPQRTSAWTGLLYDATSDEWMVSLDTPVDYQGEHLINVGTDILLNTLFDHVINDHLDGAYNFIFRMDGRIIAHPDQVDLLRENKGLLHVSETGSEELKHLATRITGELGVNGEQNFILDDQVAGAKLAVTRISGPEWVFVTVYPHGLMTAAALKTAYIVAIVGLISLLIEMLFLFRVLRQQVLEPVKYFDEFTRRFATREYGSINEFASSPVSKRRDEMGGLALAMTDMARSIEKYETRLKNIVAQRTEELSQANQVLRQESKGRKRLTTLLQSIAKDVSGLQGEDFFHRLSGFLSIELGADMVLAASLTDNGQTVQTMSMMIDGKVSENHTCPLAGTPCELVIEKGTQMFNGNVQMLFPEDQDLVDRGMTSYIGTRMLDRSGAIIGHLAVLKRSEFEEPDIGQLIVDSISARAAYEFDRQRTERVIRRQATIDSLTNLPNRAAFMDRFQQSLHQAERNDEHLAVMFIDIDNFKLVNDQQGHAVGDLVLKTIASRLVKCVRKNDVLGRLGGDEFIVALNDISSVDGLKKVAANILKEVTSDIDIGGLLLTMSCSIGISVYPQDAIAGDSLIRHADEAMYRAKDRGRNNYQFFRADMNEDIEINKLIEYDLRQAFANKELEVHYQPIMLLTDNCVYKLEALVRWNHPEKGMILPDQFIPIAERSGLIVQLGDFVLEQASKDYSRFKQHFKQLESIAVNFSARQFKDDGLIERVISIVAANNIRPRNIEIEITESLFIEDHDFESIKALHELSRLGFRLTLDDFGTGYSSLGYLKKVPIDTLKIDRSFVRDLTCDEDDMSLVRSIIELAHSLRLAVIAEGVETQAQEDMLRKEGCDFVQGYYYARPAPIAAVPGITELASLV